MRAEEVDGVWIPLGLAIFFTSCTSFEWRSDLEGTLTLDSSVPGRILVSAAIRGEFSGSFFVEPGEGCDSLREELGWFGGDLLK